MSTDGTLRAAGTGGTADAACAADAGAAGQAGPLGLGLPAAFPDPSLPSRVRIHEVGPRDGLQNEKKPVPTGVKAEFIARLADAGLRTVEATSFVRPEWVPQLADAEALMPLLEPVRARHGGPVGGGDGSGGDGRHGGLRLPVLVPNARGLDRALALGVTDVAVFASATETFARRNLNRTVDESLAMFEPVVSRARGAGLGVRGYLSMCFGDPWEGRVPVDQVVSVARRLHDMGCTELSLGDTIGVATPGHVTVLLDALTGAGVPVERLAVHFHDTYGQALSNTLAALRSGVTVVDASAGGLGGCPYAKSATGNLATEDLVWMLNGLGIDTGVDLARLAATSAWMAGHLGRPSPSRTVRALTHQE
ncbi:hydroxymethylglutaryl-CoA lyase [Streptomyces sp. SCUT-3]|uniref:hydroxymethylglutaryl-CoA lyase n=1 Tax=Streptomyces sp. SCUT-3 TaxID=2684469 RepID=UPI0015F8400E|nr:hydroxymethylglutaryl-CoA lyase [Streptomyces sp. SCUT-3]QMV23309.1 hydroxymethylglutaryl-CoA lyase [Streptomyces sp. SCUT-3]